MNRNTWVYLLAATFYLPGCKVDTCEGATETSVDVPTGEFVAVRALAVAMPGTSGKIYPEFPHGATDVDEKGAAPVSAGGAGGAGGEANGESEGGTIGSFVVPTARLVTDRQEMTVKRTYIDADEREIRETWVAESSIETSGTRLLSCDKIHREKFELQIAKLEVDGELVEDKDQYTGFEVLLLSEGSWASQGNMEFIAARPEQPDDEGSQFSYREEYSAPSD
jgi:hypothetical protein